MEKYDNRHLTEDEIRILINKIDEKNKKTYRS